MNEPEIDDVPTGEQASALIDAAMDGPIVEPVEPVEPIDPPAPPEAEPIAAIDTPAPYIHPVPDGAGERLAAIEQEITTLREGRSDGTMDPDEADAKIDALIDERTDLKVEIRLSEQSRKAAEHLQQQSWSMAQSRFFSANSEYTYKSDPVRHGALNTAVGILSTDPSTANLPYERLLDEAKTRVEQAFGVGRQAPDVKTAARAKIEGVKQAPPASLSDIPGGTASGVSEFEAVNGKDPIAMLDDVMSWGEEKRSAWLDRRL